jgi:predicted Fe-Mo cluster-binding NifX family protein
MKIAVTSQNFRIITPHAGRTRRFLVYEAAAGGEPVEVDRLDLPKELSMHEFHAKGLHPLDAVDVIIAGSFGEGFAARLEARGIAVVATELTDPIEAVKEYLARDPSLVAKLPPGRPADANTVMDTRTSTRTPMPTETDRRMGWDTHGAASGLPRPRCRDTGGGEKQ